MARECPICGLVCPETAEDCDCGYSFAQANTVGRVQLGAAGRQNMVVGGLLVIGGLLVSLFFAMVSPCTGFTVVASGAILAGAFLFIRGALQARQQPRPPEDDQPGPPA